MTIYNIILCWWHRLEDPEEQLLGYSRIDRWRKMVIFYKLVLISTVCAITSICSFYFWFLSINRPPKYKKCVRQGEESCYVLRSQLIGSHPMHRILKRSIKVAVLAEYEQVDKERKIVKMNSKQEKYNGQNVATVRTLVKQDGTSMGWYWWTKRVIGLE